MSTTVRMVLLTGIFGILMTFQMNFESDMRATSQLKFYLEIAVHDAALALDEEQLSLLEFVIDQEEAEERLFQSLEKHVNAERISNRVLLPSEDSFYQDEIEVIEIVLIDDDQTDNLCTFQDSSDPITYPCLYESEDYDFSEQLLGPSLIAIIQTTSPRYFRGDPITVTQGAIYQYRFPF